jgi:hypothetical protein
MIQKPSGIWVALISLLLLQYVSILGWALTVPAPKARFASREISPEQLEALWKSLNFWDELAALGDTARNFTGRILEEASQTYADANLPITQFRANLEELTQSVANFGENTKHLNLNDLSDSLSAKLDEIAQSYQTPLDRAPTHDERKERVGRVLGPIDEAVISVLASTGVPQDEAQKLVGVIHPLIEVVVVTTGDLFELHPELLDLIVFAGSVFIAELPILRPILCAFGFGPTGVAKGSVAAGAQRYFFGGAVTKGSWFSQLQRVAMTSGKKALNRLSGWIVGLAATFWRHHD